MMKRVDRLLRFPPFTNDDAVDYVVGTDSQVLRPQVLA